MINNPFQATDKFLDERPNISFMDSRYPLERLLLVRAKLREIVDVYTGNPLFNNPDFPMEEVRKQFTEEELQNFTINDLRKEIDSQLSAEAQFKEIFKRHFQILGFIEYLSLMDSYYDEPDEHTRKHQTEFTDPTDQTLSQDEEEHYKKFIDLRKKWHGSGLFGGWLTARRFIAAWFPGQHTLGELATQFKAWWLRTSLGQKLARTFSRDMPDLPDPASPIDTSAKHHPYVIRKQLVLETANKKLHTDKQISSIKTNSVQTFNRYVYWLLSCCKNVLGKINHTARSLESETEEDLERIEKCKELFINDRKKGKTQLRYRQLREIKKAVFPLRGQRWGQRTFVFSTVFVALCLFGVTLIGMTLLAKLGILGLLAVKFSQLPVVALGLKHLVTFLTNIQVWQYITQTPQIVMFAAATCFYVGCWLIKMAHGRNHFQSLCDWLYAYPLYARTLCERKVPLDRFNSIFLSKPKRRGIWYLPEEHSKEGADIPAHFMVVKTLLNPFRLLRAAFVIAQYIIFWPLCSIVNFAYRANKETDSHPKELHPYSFLFVFTVTVGVFDAACDFVLKPLEGLIYIFDITYDFVLPLIGKALMSPVILLYGLNSLGYLVNQGFHHLFKAEKEADDTLKEDQTADNKNETEETDEDETKQIEDPHAFKSVPGVISQTPQTSTLVGYAPDLQKNIGASGALSPHSSNPQPK